MDFEIPDQFTEAYQVVDVVSVEHASGGFRIEVVLVLKGSKREYSAAYYRRSGDAWHRISGAVTPAWVSASSADLAMHQALSFLKLYLKS